MRTAIILDQWRELDKTEVEARNHFPACDHQPPPHNDCGILGERSKAQDNTKYNW